MATGNVGSAGSPASPETVSDASRDFHGGYVINITSGGVVELVNSASIYLDTGTSTPTGALLVGRSAGEGAVTIITNERDGFLNAGTGIWSGWHSDGRTVNDNSFDSVFRVTNEGTIEAEDIGVHVHHHDFYGGIEITERGTVTSDGTGIQATGGDRATVTIEDGARIIAGEHGVRRTGRGGGTVTMDGGTMITAATADKSEAWGVVMTIEANSPDRALEAAQKSAFVDIAGVIDSGHGGVLVQNEGPGTMRVRVTEGASVTGARDGIRVEGSGSGAVTVDVTGMVSGTGDSIRVVSPGATTVTLRDNFRVDGRLKLNGADQNDILAFEVAESRRGEVLSDIEGISALTQHGDGTVYLAEDVRFATGGVATIANGTLILRGHVDLGGAGSTFTVASDTRLTIEVGPGNDDHGRITAGTITLPSGTPVHVALVDAGRAEAAERLKEGLRVFNGAGAAATEGTEVVFDRYSDVRGHTVGESGSIKYDLTSLTPDSESDGSEGGDDDSGGGATALLLIGGAQSFLLWTFFDDGPVLGSDESGQRSGTVVQSLSSTPSGIRPGDRGIEYRVRLLEHGMPTIASTLPASGVATSLRAHLGDGFHADLSGVPNLAARSGRDSHVGNRYGLGLGWQAGAFSTDIGFSRATLDTRSTFSNLAGLGVLSGTYGQRHDQLRANAKLHLGTAGLSLVPSLSLYGGRVVEEGYTASSPVWLSEISSVTRNYSGWKAGVTVAPGTTLETMGLRWRPELRLATARLADGGGQDLEVVQRDRVGAVQLQTRARTALPRSVHALGGGLTVAGDEDWSLRGGYVALLADDEVEHVALARARIRF